MAIKGTAPAGALFVVLLTACSGGIEPAPEPVASVTIAPNNPTLVPLQTTQLSATLKDASGTTLSGRTVTWTSSAAGVASVSGSGLVTAASAGSANISATSEGKSASVTVTVLDGSLIGIAGGQATGASGKVTVTVPAGALPTLTPITIVPVPNPPSDPGLVPGTVYDFGPDGTQFTQAVTLRIKYDPTLLGPGANPAQFRVAKLSGTTWTPLAGSTVDVGTNIVTGLTSSFSEYGVVETPAPVQSVVVGGQGFIVVGQAAQFTATLSDAGGHVLTGRVVTWSSSNGTIASVSTTSGLVTGLAAGGPVTITATSEGKSGSAPVTVTAPVPPVFVTGRVIDYTTQNGIANATVTIADDAGVTVGTAVTRADGGFSSTGLTVLHPASGGFLQTQATGYVSARVRIQAFTPGGTTVTETVPLVPQSSLLGGISGTVRNARTSQPISGANISLTIVGDITFNRTTTSDGSGNFSFTQLQAGTYNLDATAGADFSIASRTGVAVGNSGVTPGQDIILSPFGEIRIVLTWGSQPSDLDSHLTGPLTGGGRFHVYYASRGNLTSAPFASLDLDDVSGNGPETITIAQITAGGVYRYSVHDFSNRASTTSSALGSSGAKVQVYDTRGVAHDFFVPGGAGTLWTVFELTGPPDNPVITPLNTMGFTDSSGGITSPPALRGIATDAELIGRAGQQRKTKPR